MSDDRENHPDGGENPEKPYKVGRGRPPREHQFKKGQSGNRSGKRKPPPTYGDLLNRILRELTSAQENGRTISLTRAKAWAKSLVHFGALVGDPVPEETVPTRHSESEVVLAPDEDVAGQRSGITEI
ncbi:MAG: hypothetical protein JO058_20505, partial [Alphaproteobacteria bacterium]|nr:hypothetical protein [Alphaproteobacteria bacterium]